MHLLLFRHGIAQDISLKGDDASRELTREGIDKTKLAARGLRKIIDPPAALYTSPLIRAKQTAAILGDVFDLAPMVMPSLATGPANVVMRDLRELRQPLVILVGHEPTLSELGAMLCAGASASHFIQLKKAGAMLIDTGIHQAANPGTSELLWLATPAMLRAMA